jgi:hypothetical protein
MRMGQDFAIFSLGAKLVNSCQEWHERKEWGDGFLPIFSMLLATCVSSKHQQALLQNSVEVLHGAFICIISHLLQEPLTTEPSISSEDFSEPPGSLHHLDSMEELPGPISIVSMDTDQASATGGKSHGPGIRGRAFASQATVGNLQLVNISTFSFFL